MFSHFVRLSAVFMSSSGNLFLLAIRGMDMCYLLNDDQDVLDLLRRLLYTESMDICIVACMEKIKYIFVSSYRLFEVLELLL